MATIKNFIPWIRLSIIIVIMFLIIAVSVYKAISKDLCDRHLSPEDYTSMQLDCSKI